MEPLTLTTEEDEGIAFELLAIDDDGDDLELSVDSAVTVRRIDMWRDGERTVLEADCMYRPVPDAHGEDSFTTRISDGIEDLPVHHTIVVTPVNDSPIAVDDKVAANVNATASILPTTLFANDADHDPEYDPGQFTITRVYAAEHGTVRLNGGIVELVPAPDFTGFASFRYELSDGDKSDSAHVIVAVGATNATPIAMDDRYITIEATPLVLRPQDVTSNDFDHNAEALAVIAVDNATLGTVEIESGIVTFRPFVHVYGTGGFDYTVTDGVAVDTAHVEVEVAPILL